MIFLTRPSRIIERALLLKITVMSKEAAFSFERRLIEADSKTDITLEDQSPAPLPSQPNPRKIGFRTKD
jgi:hypothetical protein